MIDDYRKEAADRLKEGLPPLPLTAKQTAELITLLKSPHIKDTEALMALFCHRVPSGVDQAAYIKAAYLTDIAKGIEKSSIISPKYAIELLGTMVGGYNVQSLISLLDSDLADEVPVKVLVPVKVCAVLMLATLVRVLSAKVMVLLVRVSVPASVAKEPAVRVA